MSAARRVPEPAEVSVLVPFLNEVGNLAPLADELTRALEAQPRSWEVLLVDDGSDDGSLELARRLGAGDPRFRVEALPRHMGKSAALAAGQRAARGRRIVTIDADLQDDPAAIPAFLDALDHGHDVVAARREGRKEPLHRRLATAAFNRVMRLLSGAPISDMNAGLKAYRREVLESIRLTRGMHRFLAVVAHARGHSIAEIPVVHRARHSGRTKYGLGRYLETLVCLVVVGFVRRGPDHALLLLVRVGGLLAVAGACLLVAGTAWGAAWPSAVGMLLFASGAQLLTGRIVAEVLAQGRPSPQAPARGPKPGPGGQAARHVEDEERVTA